MSTPLIFKVKSIGISTRCGRVPVTLEQAARHNLRQLQKERGSRAKINPALTPLNVVLAGPSGATEVASNARRIKESYAVPKKKLRKDHVQAIEFLISLPTKSTIDSSQYFTAALEWFIKVYGKEMVLSAVVHHDEAAPHLHALVLPLVDGVYKGGALIDKTHLPNLIKSFGEEVGLRFGLRCSRNERWTNGQRHIAARMVLAHVNKHADAILSSQLWQPVRAEIERSPESYFAALGLEMTRQKTPKSSRTFTQIMTSKGRSTTEDRMHRKGQLLSCVGFPKSLISFDGSSPRPQQWAIPSDCSTQEPD